MKRIITIGVFSLLVVPFISSAATVRTEHRASSQSGGVTVSDDSGAATGDQHASVSVQNIVTGTAGHVEITTVKDGVQTTETHDFPVTGNGTTVIMTPAPNPEPPNDDRRPPREDRGSVAVQTVSVSKTNGNTVTTHTSLTTASHATSEARQPAASINRGSVFAFADVVPPGTLSSVSVHAMPLPRINAPDVGSSERSFWSLFARMFSIFSV
jgi:hypothetical protein